MCKLNLLVHIESFAWPNLSIDRTRELNDLTLTIALIKKKEDVVYSHPET